MHSSLSLVAATIAVGLLVVACGSAPSPAPITLSPSGSPMSSSASASPSSTGVPTASPSLPPLPAPAGLPLRGSAREIGEQVLMAPRPDGSLFISIPRPDGSVLALLDPSGRPRPGWPITVQDSTLCEQLLPVDDGSVRVVCGVRPDPVPVDARAFAFDAGGRSMAGWPVQLRPGIWNAGRVIGDDLTVFSGEWFGQVSHEAWVTTVAADGSIRRGTDVPIVENCCGEEWAVGPDGIAYGVVSVSGWAEGSAEVSRIMALDLSSVRAGWPVKIDGMASGPAFGPDGQIVVTVGSFVRRTSRVLVFDRDGKAILASSAMLPIATAELGVDCGGALPRPPLVAEDGTIFVFSEIDTAVLALDPSLEVMRGWPYRPATPLVRPYYADPRYEISCSSLGVPVVGPDSTLYMPLQARDEAVGGSLVAVGPDGRVRPGWPIELRRPGAEFWSVVVGSDGTAYALAIEPETGDTSSASILAIAPDSTVLYTTTIIDP